MKIFFYLRRTEDWEQINEEYLLRPNGFYDNWIALNFGSEFAKDDTCRQPLIWWNKICRTTWAEYRAKIKEIATSLWNLPHITGDAYLDLNDDDVLVPIDDDDWCHPDLPFFLSQNASRYEFGCWNTIVNSTAFGFNFHIWGNHHKKICSNGYFFKIAALKKIGPKMSLNVLHNHAQTLEISKKLQLKIMDRRDQVFSLYNWHPGSISVISQIKNPSDLKRLFPKGKIKPIPENHMWIKPGVARVESLLQSLEFNAVPVDIKL